MLVSSALGFFFGKGDCRSRAGFLAWLNEKAAVGATTSMSAVGPRSCASRGGRRAGSSGRVASGCRRNATCQMAPASTTDGKAAAGGGRAALHGPQPSQKKAGQGVRERRHVNTIGQQRTGATVS